MLQTPVRVRCDAERVPNTASRCCSFVHRDIVAALGETNGCRRPTDARANDDDLEVCHVDFRWTCVGDILTWSEGRREHLYAVECLHRRARRDAYAILRARERR